MRCILLSSFAIVAISILGHTSLAQAQQPSMQQYYGFWSPENEDWCSLPEDERDTEGDWIRIEKGTFESGVGGNCEDVGQWIEDGRLRISAACTNEAGAAIYNSEFWIEPDGLMYFHRGDPQEKSRAFRKCPPTPDKERVAQTKSAPTGGTLTTQSAPLQAKDLRPLEMPLPWPVSGKLVRGFGGSGNNFSSGLSISVPSGKPVIAVADGVVAYEGSEVRGLPNLILVRHVGSWISAYALNKQLLVKRNDVVRRGQSIAASGTTLYFELRQGSTKPVDPVPYLVKVGNMKKPKPK